MSADEQGDGVTRGRTRPIRVIVAKIGLDGHDRGAKVVARAFRDAGMEVIYTGLHRSPEEVVEAALQEDVDVLGISVLSGAHMTLVPRVVELVKEEGLDDVVLVVGGIMPVEDADRLRASGVAEVFGPGTEMATLVDFVKRAVRMDRG